MNNHVPFAIQNHIEPNYLNGLSEVKYTIIMFESGILISQTLLNATQILF
jgi:hypothetical protein